MNCTTSKKHWKTFAAFALIMTMIVMVVPFGNFSTVEAASYITSAGSASGSNYTASSGLASKLNTVFAGDIGLCSNTSFKTTVNAKLGSSVMTSSKLYYVKSNTTGSLTSGWQCYIYANAVYNTLFNEWVGRGTGFSHSKVLISGGNTASYSQFNKAGVKCGAYIRTTTNSSGAYNGSAGHSMIVLSYNSSNITYLEGNADGAGLVRITTRTWSDFNSNQLSGKSRYICHVVQPTDTYYNSLYSVSSGSGSTTATTKSTTTTAKTTTTTAAASSTTSTADPASCKVSYSRMLSYKSSVMSGNDVKYVQTCLKYLGYTVNINSKYDSTTLAAVKKFQAAASIKVDGYCGSGTWKTLESAVAAKKNLKITTQPKDDSAPAGQRVNFAIKATGTGLTYQWQLSDDNGKTWYNSTVKTNTYTVTMCSSNNNRTLHCIVTDKYGNTVTTNSVKMKIK